MKKLQHILLFLFVLFTVHLSAQTIPWTVNSTGVNHTIFIDTNTIILTDNNTLKTGDAIGVFYDSLGTSACGGYMEWKGNSSFIVAYGFDGNTSGFATNELFTFKIWKKSTDCIIENVSASFSFGSIRFTTDGMSATDSILGTSASISYSQSLFCSNDNISYLPVCDIDTSFVNFESQSQLFIDNNTGIINILGSDTGVHSIHYQSDACMLSKFTTITINPSISIELGNDSNTCNGLAVSLDAGSGIASYKWSTSETSQEISANTSGTYSVTISDTEICTDSDSIQIIISPEIIIDNLILNYENAECIKKGSIVIDSNSVSGGILPLSYLLQNNSTKTETKSENGLFNDVIPGTYHLTVTDSINCAISWNETTEIIKDCRDVIVTPNGDGIDDELFVPYTGNTKVYDRFGHLRAEFVAPFNWDTRDSFGKLLPMGTYMIICDDNQKMEISIIK